MYASLVFIGVGLQLFGGCNAQGEFSSVLLSFILSSFPFCKQTLVYKSSNFLLNLVITIYLFLAT